MTLQPQPSSEQSDTPHTCHHERELQILVHRSTLAMRRGSTAGTLSTKMLANEKMAACQVECGDTSPYRDVELEPMSQDAAAAQLCPDSGIDVLLDTVTGLARSLRGRLRSLLGHGGTDGT